VFDTHADPASIQNQLRIIHANLKAELPEVGRIAVAVYDAETDVLKTFIHSTEGRSPFSHYDRKLAEVPSLAALAESRLPRIIDDLDKVGPASGGHTRSLLGAGYRSSYTEPLYDGRQLFGFLFFDSQVPRYFSRSAVTRHIGVYAQLIRLMILHALAPATTLRSAVEITKFLGHIRDSETGAHLDRMSRYARLIAKTLADRDPEDAIDDEFVEFIFLFAPLHDVGKIGIPDSILLKPGKLSEPEFAIMKTHVSKGVAIVDRIAAGFGVGHAQHVDVLRNIVRYHHEAYDGSGYLEGLASATIPLEARIITVADVFDALTSRRSYKQAWSNDDALDFLETRAGRSFDPDCVTALIENRREVEAIQRRFAGDGEGVEGFHEAYSDVV
jgi:HD-GYP domain-containing protein (c-di-GMP phosphodiesterase class II)